MVRMAVAAAMCLGTTACATMVNPGKVAPANGGGPTARLRLKNVAGLQAVYVNGSPVEIQDEADHDLHVAVCRTFREDQNTPIGYVTVNRDCMQWILFPYIDLDKSRPNNVRVVTTRGEGTVTVRPSLHIGWFWANGVWLAAAPVGWVVDIASGRMSYYGKFDVAQAVSRSGSAASSGTR